jgi:anti-sigma B factor antagonist
MEIKVADSDKANIVSVIGSIDALTSEQIAEVLEIQIRNSNKYIIIDLGQVEFMSSAGLRVILGSLKQVRQQGGDLYLADAQPGVERVLKMSGFVTILKSFASVDAALSEIGMNC